METINNDIRFLTETLEHRQSATEQEEQAADYVLGRLKPYVDGAHKSSFPVVENFRFVMAAYYGDFALTCVLACWWPAIAFFYGMVFFLAYVAEYIGYPVFSRLLTLYESSSIVGFNNEDESEKVLVFTAYLDSEHNPASSFFNLNMLRLINATIMAVMVIVLASCLVQSYTIWQGAENPLAWWIIACGGAFFSVAGIVVFLVALNADVSQGANHNASGVSALLQIAERLHNRRIRNTSVLFYFAGGHYANMAGMRALVREITALNKDAYVINIEGVGTGQLCFTEAEGMLLNTECSGHIIQVARTRSKRYNARGVRIHNFATNAYLPLIRGLKAITLVGLDEHDHPINYRADTDTRHTINPESILKAARFAESIGRGLIKELRENDEAH